MTTTKQLLKVKMNLLGSKTIEIKFSDHNMAKDFYDFHKNFMVFLNTPIKTIELA
jgi:hypothetical protein